MILNYLEYGGRDGLDGYHVNLQEALSDVKLWRVYRYGYPYSTPEQLGVETEEDAYLATKQAGYWVLRGRSLEQLDGYFRAGQTAIAGQNLSEIKRRGQKVVDAIYNLVYKAYNSTETPANSNIISISKSGDFVLDNNKNYYSQIYSVTSATSMQSYSITKFSGFPSGSYIADLNGNAKTTFSSGQKFKVMIPKESLNNNISGKIEIKSVCKTYPVYFGKSSIPNYQDYAVTVDSYEDITKSTTLDIDVFKSGIIAIKKDEDKETYLSGVTYNAKYSDGTNIGNFTTDKNGKITINNLRQGKVVLTEISTKNEYILDTRPINVDLEYNQIKTVELTNKHKKGNLKIYKVDLDDNKIPVSDVEFEVIDQDGYKYTAVSDENGIAYIENIRTGIATIKETKTNKIYKLSEETYESDIKWNETTELTITNEKLKGQIEVYKLDAENKEIKLEGVEFQVINSNDEVIETIVTDSNGYAITSRIPIGEYRLKETKTDNMHILNEEIIKVDVSADIISKLEITNERIKGQIKVIKTSEDDNFINGKESGSPIENVKFEIYDSNNNLVDEITTSADGISITKLLDKGSYFIKEVESGEWYLLNENTFTAEIKEHQEIINVEITNESEKPSVDIEKTGLIQTTANQEIKYDFVIKNTGNVPLSNFTWYDYLPTDYVRITKLITGTYNQDLNYSIYYKTNKNDYKLLKDNLNTGVNNYIDFSNLDLEADEYVTEFKADFGTVDVGFKSVINPYIFVKVNSNVNNNDIFTNKTRIEGYNKTYMVWDEDEHKTKLYEKEIKVKKLPRTGM